MSDGNNWATAWDLLTGAIKAAGGTIDNLDALSVDQRFKVAEIAAMLAISQDVNHLRHMGMNPEFDNGL